MLTDVAFKILKPRDRTNRSQNLEVDDLAQRKKKSNGRLIKLSRNSRVSGTARFPVRWAV